MKEEDEAAILVRRARKCYGTKDRKYILDDLDMTVKKGTMWVPFQVWDRSYPLNL